MNASFNWKWLLAVVPVLAVMCCCITGGGVIVTRAVINGSARAFLPANRDEEQAPIPVEATVPAFSEPTRAAVAVVIAEERIHEIQSEPLKYEIDARYPRLEWDSGAAAAFNTAVQRAVDEDIHYFLEQAQDANPHPTNPEFGSSLYTDFATLHTGNGYLSVLMRISTYYAGAAHPGTYSRAFNYDLENGELLELDDLFAPGSEYLPLLADTCLNDLRDRGVLAWEDGALPTPENYRVWNLTPGGLQITFDEYSVAPYAAGRQQVVIPYENLRAIRRSGGPLDRIAP